jgi:Lhr-like helicase
LSGHLRKSTKRNELGLKAKYAEIYDDLQLMSLEDLIDLFLEQLEDNSMFKLSISNCINKTHLLEESVASSREELKRKSDRIEDLCKA